MSAGRNPRIRRPVPETMSARRTDEMRTALERHRRALGWAALCAFACGVLAALTAVLCVALLLLVHARPERPLRPWLVIVAALATACVATSRVLLGVHYPTDVVGGILLGVATALALTPILTLGRP